METLGFFFAYFYWQHCPFNTCNFYAGQLAALQSTNATATDGLILEVMQ